MTTKKQVMKDYLRRADHDKQVKIARSLLDKGELYKDHLKRSKEIKEGNLEEIPDTLTQEVLDEFTYTK
jgi:transcription initiation factor IIE alpha subunit